jgi:hypothetical protein
VRAPDTELQDVFKGFEMRRMDARDPAITARIDAFYDKMKTMKAEHVSDAYTWFGLFKDGIVHLVAAVHFRPDKAIEITDFYPAPTRDGADAGYVLLNLMKILVDRKIIPFCIGGIVDGNIFGKRHVEKFFGIKPRCSVYVYEGTP